MLKVLRHKLRNVVFHVFLDMIIHLRQTFVPEIIVPLDNFDSLSRLSVLLNPCRNLRVARAGRDKILELVRGDSSEFKKHAVERTIEMVFAQGVIERSATLVQRPHPDDVPAQ